MANTTVKTTTPRKEWKPNEKQVAFMETLKTLGTATFRQIKEYVANHYDGMAIATGSVNVLATKQLVGSKDMEFETETTTTYHYPSGDIVETKKALKKEKVYYLISEEDRLTFEKSNLAEKGTKVANPTELDNDDVDCDLEDVEE